MNPYATEVAEQTSTKLVEKLFEKSFFEEVTNQNYQGEVQDKLTKLKIFTFGDVAWDNYSGPMTADKPQESVGILTTDQVKKYYIEIDSLDQLKSAIKDPSSTLLANASNGLKKLVDQYICSFYPDVAAGNRIGTDLNDSSTITITTHTGAFVVSGGTPITAACVGRGIKAVGHDKWYRIASVSSTTEGVIEDDEDDDLESKTYPYNGGPISGASYVIEAVTPVQLTKTTIYDKIVDLGELLDGDGESNETPDEDRYLLVVPKVYSLLKKSETLIMPLESVNSNLIQKGYVGDVDRFHVIKTNRIVGNNTDGYHCLGIHKSFITFGFALTKSQIEADIIGDFGKGYKALAVYGGKVVDLYRHSGAELFCYV